MQKPAKTLNGATTSDERQIFFPPFTLDTANESLSRGSEILPLRPKSLAILRYLVEHQQQLITKAELMRALWPQAKVLDATLKVSIGEIRKVLGDHATQSKFIETVGTKGYRFIAPISLRLSGSATGSSFSPVVGRATELERLRHHLGLANQGKRQLVFVTGEPGIGKTTLVELFAKNLATNGAIITARGQCIEQYGAGEAYMPIIDAVERMCQGSNGDSRVSLLRRYAPSWLVNLHELVSAEDRSELQRQSIGITPERRLREIAAFLEALAKDQTVILALQVRGRSFTLSNLSLRLGSCRF